MLGLGAIGIGTQILGGILGHQDARDVERQQREWINRADSQYAEAIEGLLGAQATGRGFMEEAAQMLLALEEDGLAGYDEVYAQAVQRTLRDREAARSTVRASMSQRGLGNSTIQESAMRGQDFLAEQALGELAAAFAENRAGLLGQFRQIGAGALTNQAQFELSSQAAIADAQSRRAGLFGSVQVQGPDTAAAVGAIGSNIGNLMMQQWQTETISQALAGLGGN